MKYEKPSVTLLGAATAMVQGDAKGSVFVESIVPDSLGTPAAYQSDE